MSKKSIGGQKKTAQKIPVSTAVSEGVTRSPGGLAPMGARHSLLLALEPRQVFDADAFVPDITPALDDTGDNQNEPAGDQAAAGLLRAEGGAGDGLTDPRGDLLETVGGREPLVVLDGEAGLSPDGSFALSNISVIDFTADDRLYTFTLTAEGGIIEGRVIEPGMELSADGRALTFRNMGAEEISRALAEFSFQADPAASAGRAALSWSLVEASNDSSASRAEGRAELLAGSAEPSALPAPLSLMSGRAIVPLGADIEKDGLTLKVLDSDQPGANKEYYYLSDVLGNNSEAAIYGLSVDYTNDDAILKLVITVDEGTLGATRSGLIEGLDEASVSNEGRTLTLKGTAKAINDFLGLKADGQIGQSGLNYHTNSDLAAHEVVFDLKLTTVAVDGGDSGDPLTHSVTVKVNRPPTITMPDGFTGIINEKTPTNNYENSVLSFKDITIDDPNAGDTLTLTLTLNNGPDGPLGRLYHESGSYLKDGDQTFTITGTAAEVRAALDKLTFEGDPYCNGQLTFTITVTDEAGSPTQIADRALTITSINDPPEIEAYPTDQAQWPSVFENRPWNGGLGDQPVSKVELDNRHFGINDTHPRQDVAWDDLNKASFFEQFETDPSQIIITITALPAKGTLYGPGGNILGLGATFSLADLNANKVTYQHSGTAEQVGADGGEDSFKFRVNDGSGTSQKEGQIKININPVNADFSVTGTEQAEGESGPIVLWAWEGQNNAYLWAGAKEGSPQNVIPGGGIILDTGPDDDLSNFKFKVETLPDSNVGKLFITIGGVRTELRVGDTYSAEYLPTLIYMDVTENGREPHLYNDTWPAFSLTFSDHHDLNKGALDNTYNESISKTYEFMVKIAPNNDDPVLKNNEGLGRPDDRWIYDAQSSVPGRNNPLITITPEMIQVTDPDSEDPALVFTVTQAVSKYGYLLYYDGAKYWTLEAGNDFSMQDVRDGKIIFEYVSPAGDPPTGVDDGRNYWDLTTDFKFTVRDGSLSSWPDKSHWGGIYDYEIDSETGRPVIDPVTGRPVIKTDGGVEVLTIHSFAIHLKVYHDGSPGTYDPHPTPFTPEVSVYNDRVTHIAEGPGVNPHSGIYDHYLKITGGPSGMIDIYDQDTSNDSLILNLSSVPKGGQLIVYREGEAHPGGAYDVLFDSGSFTYQALVDGRVYYVHGGGEIFQDSLLFWVSDGAHDVKTIQNPNANDNGGVNEIRLNLNIIPVNDDPGIISIAPPVMNEGGALELNKILDFDDPDGKSVEGPPKFDKNDDPRNPAILAEDKLTLTFSPGSSGNNAFDYGHFEIWDTGANGGRGGWVKATPVGGSITIDYADFRLEGRGLRYVHGGDDDHSQVTFKVTVNDNSTELGGPGSDARDVTIDIVAVNDPPELKGNVPAVVTEVPGGGGKDGDGSIILSGNPDISNPGLKAADVDDIDPKRVTYYLEESCKYGSLYLTVGGKVTLLGKGDNFTQDDLNEGRISYVHNGFNQHKDSFQFKIHDGSKYYWSEADLKDEFGLGGGDQIPDLDRNTFGYPEVGATVSTFFISITPVNEAPTLTGMENMQALYEDDASKAVPLNDNGQPLVIGDLDLKNRNPNLIDDATWNTAEDGTYFNDNMQLTFKANLGDYSDNPGTAGLAIGKFDLDYAKAGYADLNAYLTAKGLTITRHQFGEMVLTGSMESLNDALKYVTFKATDVNPQSGNPNGADYHADPSAYSHLIFGDLDQTAYITINVNDLNNGAIGQHDNGLDLTRHLRVHVSPVNDPPVFDNLNTNIATKEDVSVYILGDEYRDPNSGKLAVADNDAFDRKTNVVTIEVGDEAKLSLGSGSWPGGLKREAIGETGGLKLTGSLTDINYVLARLKYMPEENFSGTAEIRITYDGTKNTGATQTPGDHVIEKIIDVTIMAVNDKPLVTIDADKTQSIGGTKYPTAEINSSDQIHGNYYEVGLKDLVTIDDPKDLLEPGQSALEGTIADAPVTVKLSAKDFYDSSVLGCFILAKTSGGFDTEAKVRAEWDRLIAEGTLEVVSGLDTDTITLKGTFEDLSAALELLAYAVPKDTAEDPNPPMALITVELDDHFNGDSAGLNHDDIHGSDHKYGQQECGNTDQKEFLVNISIDNKPPVVTGGNISVYEDLYSETANTKDFGGTKAVNIDERIGGDGLKVDDPDAFHHEIKYTVTLLDKDGNPLADQGRLYLGLAAAGQAVTGKDGVISFTGEATLIEINKLLDNLYFAPKGDWNGDLTLKITIDDKGNTGGQGLTPKTGEGVYTITVKPVNDAPIVQEVDGGKTAGLPDMDEIEPGDNGDSILGQKVSDLFSGYFTDPNDPDNGQRGRLGGILITGDASNPSSEGVWQYKPNGAAGWTDLPAGLGETKALYLAADTELRFLPNADYNGEPGRLTMRLVETMPTKEPLYTDSTYPALVDGNLFDIKDHTDLGSGSFGTIAETLKPYTADSVKLAVKVDPTNDAPVWTGVPSGFTVDEDGQIPLQGLTFNDIDIKADGNNDTGQFKLTVTVTHGTITSGSLPSGVSSAIPGPDGASITFTGTLKGLNDLLAGNAITYKPTGNYYGPAEAAFIINDGGSVGGETTGLKAVQKVAIKVNPVNDAPVVGGADDQGQPINPGHTFNPFAPVVENQGPTAGRTVADIFKPGYDDSIDEKYAENVADKPDSHYTFAGVLVTKDNSGSSLDGHWEYKPSGGNWAKLPDIQSGQAIYLDKDTELRFVPKSDWYGQAGTLDVRLVDGTHQNLPNGTVIPMPLTGDQDDTTAISGAADNLKVTATVRPVNKAPVWKQDGSGAEIPIIPIEVNEDFAGGGGQDGLSVQDILNKHFDDSPDKVVDNPAGLLITGIKTPAEHGAWEYSDDNGQSWKTISFDPDTESFFLNPEAVLRFKPAAEYSATDAQAGLTVRLADDYSDGLKADSPSGAMVKPVVDPNDPTNVYSDERELTLRVKPINDAPEALEAEAWLGGHRVDQSAAQGGQSVADLLGPLFSDRLDKVGGSPGNSFAGIFVIGSEAKAGEGVWQYLDAAGDWVTLDPSPDQAVFLSVETQVRFLAKSSWGGGEPGALLVRLVEADEPVTGPATELPSGILVPGGIHDLTGLGQIGGDSRVSGEGHEVRLRIRVEAAPPADNHIPDKDPAIRQDEHRDWSQNNETKPFERPVYDFPAFEREGLDSPQYRTGSALDGSHQEVPLITDHHVGNVVQHTTDHFNNSVNNGLTSITDTVDTRAHYNPPVFSGELYLQDQGGSGAFTLDRDHLARYLGPGPVFCRAVMADGSELPDWLAFDQGTLTVTVVDPGRLLEEDEIHLRAVNASGHMYTMKIRLRPGDPAATLTETGPEDEAPPAETSPEPSAALIPEAWDQRLINEAGASFENLWENRPAAPETENLARDADLDRKMETRTLSSLWLKAQKMMTELAS